MLEGADFFLQGISILHTVSWRSPFMITLCNAVSPAERAVAGCYGISVLHLVLPVHGMPPREQVSSGWADQLISHTYPLSLTWMNICSNSLLIFTQELHSVYVVLHPASTLSAFFLCIITWACFAVCWFILLLQSTLEIFCPIITHLVEQRFGLRWRYLHLYIRTAVHLLFICSWLHTTFHSHLLKTGFRSSNTSIFLRSLFLYWPIFPKFPTFHFY